MNNRDFINSLIEEHIQWRVTELALIKKIYLKLQTDEEKRFFLQSSIPTVYAIWEGFVKKILKSLLQFLDIKEIPPENISEELLVWSLTDKLKALRDSKDFKKKIKNSQLLIQQLRNEVKFSKFEIDTKSNLNDKVLKELCGNFGLFDINIFFTEDELNKLKELIKKRNSISHGDETAISLNLIQEYIVLVTKLMDNWILFIDDFLENEKFLKAVES
jgi:hypothetical protein